MNNEPYRRLTAKQRKLRAVFLRHLRGRRGSRGVTSSRIAAECGMTVAEAKATIHELSDVAFAYWKSKE